MLQNETEKDAIKERAISITISDEAINKIRNWINLCPTECGGLGTVYTNEAGDIYIRDVFIFKQIGSGGYFRVCNEDRAKFEMSLIKGTNELIDSYLPEHEKYEEYENMSDEEKLELRKEIGKYIYGHTRLHWHSHVSMNVFWSSTDTAAADNMTEQCNWAIMIVGNKRDEIKVKYVQKNPNVIIDNIKLTVSGELREKCRKEVETLVLSPSEYEYDEEDDKVVKKRISTFSREFNPHRSNSYWNIDRDSDQTSDIPSIEDFREDHEDLEYECPHCKTIIDLTDESCVCSNCKKHLLADAPEI